MILLSQVAAVHRIRVRSLFREGDVDRALVREDVQVVPAASGDVEQPERCRGPRILVRWVHQHERQCGRGSHRVLLVPQGLAAFG